ncbi:hypothetical protein ACFQDN_20935 [Pseudomonas asuensis]|uniref:Uncharacterized protein n=1 Tax=Pseudomonas asuensis TaxID=1825787 RepID=A0ABQ2H2Y0_9PSED|nr:hypothetical protein [Pseudomonas asuensis]GGM30471.1 hypothetical protein GCM10009425_46330 [Pseudomonas asuensis]
MGKEKDCTKQLRTLLKRAQVYVAYYASDEKNTAAQDLAAQIDDLLGPDKNNSKLAK